MISPKFYRRYKNASQICEWRIKKLFSQVEEEMVDHFINEEIPEQYQSIYRERLQEGKDDSLEGQILSVADKIDLLYETFGEIQKRNPEPLFLKYTKCH